MAHPDHGVNIATRVEIGFQLHPERIAGCHEIVEDPIGDVLVEDSLVAEGLEIQFKALQLHAGLIGHVAEREGAEVWLAGLRAYRGELWTDMLNGVIPARELVGKGLKLIA